MGGDDGAQVLRIVMGGDDGARKLLHSMSAAPQLAQEQQRHIPRSCSDWHTLYSPLETVSGSYGATSYDNPPVEGALMGRVLCRVAWALLGRCRIVVAAALVGREAWLWLELGEEGGVRGKTGIEVEVDGGVRGRRITQAAYGFCPSTVYYTRDRTYVLYAQRVNNNNNSHRS